MDVRWCTQELMFQIVVMEKTLDSPLDCKEIKSVNAKGNQHWIFTGRTDAEAEASILWPPHGKNWLIRKDPDAGKDWRQEEKRMTEDKMVGWHHRLKLMSLFKLISITWWCHPSIEGGDRWMASLRVIDMSLNKLQQTLKLREAWGAAVHEVTKSSIWLSNWITRATFNSYLWKTIEFSKGSQTSYLVEMINNLLGNVNTGIL